MSRLWWNGAEQGGKDTRLDFGNPGSCSHFAINQLHGLEPRDKVAEYRGQLVTSVLGIDTKGGGLMGHTSAVLELSDI
jgi:hypothetical protein